MTDVVDRLKKDFQDPEYRYIYDEGFLNSLIATQIKTLREERGWTQAMLAQEAKMSQSRISELEDVNFNSWTIRTLRKLATAFDLRLKISFEEFGSLLSDFKHLNRESLSRRSFKKDPAFKGPVTEAAILAISATPTALTEVPPRSLLDLIVRNYPQVATGLGGINETLKILQQSSASATLAGYGRQLSESVNAINQTVIESMTSSSLFKGLDLTIPAQVNQCIPVSGITVGRSAPIPINSKQHTRRHRKDERARGLRRSA